MPASTPRSSALICDTLTPLTVETALTVTGELAADAPQGQRSAPPTYSAQNAADSARRRYLAVDPANRLVTDNLEADWNTRCAEAPTPATTTPAPRHRRRAHQAQPAASWPWPRTSPLGTARPPMRERKRLLRLLHHRRHPGPGRRRRHPLPGPLHRRPAPHPPLPRPLAAAERHPASPATVELIGQLLDDHPFDEIAAILNGRESPAAGAGPSPSPTWPRSAAHAAWARTPAASAPRAQTSGSRGS